MLSVFGSTGFIGAEFVQSRTDCFAEPREGRVPAAADLVYFNVWAGRQFDAVLHLAGETRRKDVT